MLSKHSGCIFLHTLAAASLCLFLAACGKEQQALDEITAISAGNGRELDLESEHVSLRPDYVTCGVDNELFEQPVQVNTRMVAALTENARKLGFTDDVSMNEAGYEFPYTQVRGKFSITLRKVVTIKDADEGAKKVEAWAGVKIDHPCFPSPLPIMGVKKGSIQQNQAPAFQFAWTGEVWQLERILHQ